MLREVAGIDGAVVVYRVTGPPDGRPVVLIHGWAQSSACWGEAVVEPLARQYRVIAVDLRGHGYSDAPMTGYDDSAVWAGDIAAVLAREGLAGDALAAGVRGAVLVGWSYGGLVVADYLATHGTALVAGIVLVGAITSLGTPDDVGRIGPAMKAALPAATSEDPRTAIRGLSSFGSALTGPGPGLGEQAQALYGASLSTRPRVRSAVFRRSVSHESTLADLDVPALVIHGTADRVVDISAGQHAASLIPSVTTSWWDGVDHGPFVADPQRFVTELEQFIAPL